MKTLKERKSNLYVAKKDKRFMKKTKILTVLGVLLAMGVTACGGSTKSSSQVSSESSVPSTVAPSTDSSPAPQSSDSSDVASSDSSVESSIESSESSAAESSESSAAGSSDTSIASSEDSSESSEASSEISSECKHSWGAWEVTTQPTCTEPGEQQRVCEKCNEVQTKEKAALGHDFENGTVVSDTSTCTEAGVKVIKCSRCEVTQEFPAEAGHKYGEDIPVAADAEKGTVDYKKSVCTVDGTTKVVVNQSVFSYDEGSSRKDGTPEGYTKLNGNNQTWRFKFDFDKYAKGKLYLYGCMDGWKSNYSKKAFSYNSKPNIGVTVNGQALKEEALSNVVYTDFLTGDNESGELSDDGYGFIGNIVLTKGVNEIAYSRLASMNTLVKDVVFVLDEVYDEEITETTVAAETGYVGYKKVVNNLTGATKLEIRALDGTFADGSSNKNGTEEGYMKLNSNGNKISWKFKSEKAAVASIYQVGFMDSFSSNTLKTYAWISSSNSTTTEEGNFRVSINDSVIDKSAYMDITFQDLTKDGEVLFEESKNYSPVALCPIGDLVLKAGDNTLTYERLGSYNFAVSALVIVINEEADADFVVEETLSSDDNAHYHAVTGTNVVFDKASHTWASDTDLAATDTESTCSEHGIAHEKCSVCGKTRERQLDLLPHTWVSDPDLAATDTESTCTEHGVAHMICSVCGATEEQELPLGDHAITEGTVVQNSDSKDVTPLECSACHKVGAKMSIDDYSSGTFDKDSDKTPGAIRPSQNKAIVYKIVVSKAGTYILNFGFLCKSNGGVAMSQRKLAVSVGEVAQTMILDETKTPDNLGMNGTTPVQLDIAEVTLEEGENTISLVCASYRLHYSGVLRVLEK